MKVFEKVLKKKFPGKRITFFKKNATLGGYISPNHYGGAVVHATEKHASTVYIDTGNDILRFVMVHGGNPDEIEIEPVTLNTL